MGLKKLMFIGVLGLCSCDCLQSVQGIVVDERTGIPLEDVAIERRWKKESGVKDTVFTDSNGKYEYVTMTGGLLGCPKVGLTFQKEGYKLSEKKFKSCCTANDTINLKAESILFNKDNLFGKWELDFKNMEFGGCGDSAVTYTKEDAGVYSIELRKDDTYTQYVWGHKTVGTYLIEENRLVFVDGNGNGSFFYTILKNTKETLHLSLVECDEAFTLKYTKN